MVVVVVVVVVMVVVMVEVIGEGCITYGGIGNCVSRYPWLRVIFQLMTTPLTTRFVHCTTFYCVYKDIAIYIIYTYTRLDLYNYYDDDVDYLWVCGNVTSSPVTPSLRSVIDTPVASTMIINLWVFTPRQRFRTMM